MSLGVHNGFIAQITSMAAEYQETRDTLKEKVHARVGVLRCYLSGSHPGSNAGRRDVTHANGAHKRLL